MITYNEKGDEVITPDKKPRKPRSKMDTPTKKELVDALLAACNSDGEGHENACAFGRKLLARC